MIQQLSVAFQEAFTTIHKQNIPPLTDIYLQVSADEMCVTFYDDEENILLASNMDDLAQIKGESKNFEISAAHVLKEVMHLEAVRGVLNEMNLIKPFSVILVDDTFREIEELICLDDSVVFLQDDFLKNLDKELDQFLEQLLKDI